MKFIIRNLIIATGFQINDTNLSKMCLSIPDVKLFKITQNQGLSFSMFQELEKWLAYGTPDATSSSDAILRHRSWSALFQVFAQCLFNAELLP